MGEVERNSHMPELPEVETIKNELAPHVIGRQITGVTLLWEGIVRHPSAEEFRSRLPGQEITGLTRRGKYLSFHLASGETLIIHLKMTGGLWLIPPDRFTRAVVNLDNGSIFFRDPRKFGSMWLVRDSSILKKLGVEPLEPGFTPRMLAGLLAKRQAPIKAVLLEQALIAGIGNMYADEALFTARIHPQRPAASLSTGEIERLHGAIRQVLLSGISSKGASTDTYFRPDGSKGTAHLQFQVAHRGGQPCPVCGTPIQRLAIRNRGSYSCPNCQH